jgi:tetratricopeptide (TPR) repeat protein
MPDSGIYYLQRAVQYDPKRADAWNNLGVFNFNKQNFRVALNFYKTSLEIKPSYMEAWYNQGNAYMNLGILDSAKLSFEQVLRLKPEFDQAYVSLGNIYANTGNPVKQIENYQMAARYGNKDAQQWLKQNKQSW